MSDRFSPALLGSCNRKNAKCARQSAQHLDQTSTAAFSISKRLQTLSPRARWIDGETRLHPSFLSQLKAWLSPWSLDDVSIGDHTVITDQQPSCSRGNDHFRKLPTKGKKMPWLLPFIIQLIQLLPFDFLLVLALFGTRWHLQFGQKFYSNQAFSRVTYFLINELLFGFGAFNEGWRILSSWFLHLITRIMLLQYS